EMMGAASVRDARQAAAKIMSPSVNLVLADRTTIALQSTGRAPLRGPNHASRGQMPAAGWVARNDWQGFVPFDQMPFALNPVGGIVVNTNNRLTDEAYPKHFTYDWGDSQRIERARLLLGGRQFHTLDSFVEIQTDIVSPAARALLPLIGRDLWYTDGPAPSDSPTRLRRQALEALAAWNGEMTEHGAEPLIYAAWIRALQRRLILDELGGLAARFTTPDALFLERVFRDTDGAATWCDIQTSARVESCSEMASQALDAALIELSELYGTRLEAWRWGEAHAALHRHMVLGELPLIHWLFNIRQPTGGGDHTLMRAQMRNAGPTPYINTHAAGYRMVVDFSDPDASRFVLATGQSGHFLSRHYDDLSVLWRRGEYLSMSLDPVLARAGADGITELTPL
ncbi:MAG: penicillin acylase family protein, partial [Pseudomonadota bacterium]